MKACSISCIQIMQQHLLAYGPGGERERERERERGGEGGREGGRERGHYFKTLGLWIFLRPVGQTKI